MWILRVWSSFMFCALWARLSHHCSSLWNPRACLTLFPKGSPRWHSLVWMCVFSFSRHSVLTVSVTLQLIPWGRHDSYSCQAVTKDNVLILDWWPCKDLWPFYTCVCVDTHLGCFNAYMAAKEGMEERHLKKHGMHSIWMSLNLELFYQAVRVHAWMWWKIWVPRLKKPSL